MKQFVNWMVLGGWLALLAQAALAQPGTQVVRGTVRDAVVNAPVVGATVVVLGVPGLGASTDANGRFRVAGVPVGRVQLRVSALGYEESVRGDVGVTAGQETVLDLTLTERLTTLDEVRVTYDRTQDQRVPNNELATVSTRPFSPQEANRYAGSLGDPARMAQNFAGVSGANDTRNDLVVRGNSPASLLWRLEGVNIPNPSHFGALGTTGGPVSMLNNNLLAKSDFLTGAFPAEYANALGAVFDLRLRKGNDERREYLGQVAFNGLEVGAEGPFSSRSKASYLLNYRYSLFSLLKVVGYDIAGTPYYQDFTAKVDVPVGSGGNFSAWTIGGRSNITFLGRDVDSAKADVYGSESQNTRVRYFTGMAAARYEQRFSNRLLGQLTLSGSRAWNGTGQDTILFANGQRARSELASYTADFQQDKLSANARLTCKASAHDKLVLGLIEDWLRYDFTANVLYPQAHPQRASAGTTAFRQLYAEGQHRFSERLTLNAGLSYSRLALNGSAALEPRLGLQLAPAPGTVLSVAYGLHSTMQPLLTYFYESRQPDNSYALTNRNLGLTRAHHLVLGVDRQLSPNLHLRLEGYAQWLFDVPVEQVSSAYSLLNQGATFGPTNRGNLVNAGTGRNYGLELTLERVFAGGYYFLLTGSLFESKYRGSDGVAHNTAYNTRRVLNALAGREWAVGRHASTLTLSGRVTTTGGRYASLLNLPASAAAGQAVYADGQAFSQLGPAYFRADEGELPAEPGAPHPRAGPGPAKRDRPPQRVSAGLQPPHQCHRHGLPAGVFAGAVLPAHVLSCGVARRTLVATFSPMRDKWFRMVGEPAVAAVMQLAYDGPASFGAGHLAHHFWVPLLSSVTFWEGGRAILLALRRYYPHQAQTPRRLVVLALALLAFVAANTLFTNWLPWVLAGIRPTTFALSYPLNLVPTFFIVSLYESAYYFSEWKNNLHRSEALARGALQAELDVLQRQLDPHFLFNSLNTLAAVIHDDNTEAQAFVEQLADVYRYVLLSRDKQTVPLAEELAFVQAYVALNKTRFRDDLLVEQRIGPGAGQGGVAPLSLQMLVENALKHNVISAESPLRVTLSAEAGPGGSYVSVANNVQPKNHPPATTKVGLLNIIRRYRLLTPQPVEVRDEAGRFVVRLPLLP